jgi:hypothetical protein
MTNPLRETIKGVSDTWDWKGSTSGPNPRWLDDDYDDDGDAENSFHITMCTPETLLTKYLRTSRQNSELHKTSTCRFQTQQYIYFNFYLNKNVYCCFVPKPEILFFLPVQ